LTNDAELTLRVSRLLWKMGYFVRRSVQISAYTPSKWGPRRSDVTDIDVLGICWGGDFEPNKVVCECKSGGRAKPLDRSFWLRGVMNYFGAEKGYLVVREAGLIPSNVGRRMGVIVLDYDLLSDWEKRYQINEGEWFGSFKPDLDTKISGYRKMLGQLVSPQLNYIVYGYWGDLEFYQLKRLITMGKELTEKKIASTTEAYRWLSIEAINLFAAAFLGFCHKLCSTPPKEISESAYTELFGGFLSKTERESITQKLVELMSTYIQTEYGDKFPLRPEHLSLRPEYFDGLVDLIMRTLSHPNEAILIPRFIDFVCYEFLYPQQEISKEQLTKFFENNNLYTLTKMAKNILNFYLDSTGIDREIFKPLLDF
jgi:hypothetical protein